MSIKESKRGAGAFNVVVEIGNDWLKIVRISNTSAGPVLAAAELLRLDSINGLSAAALGETLRRMGAVRNGVYACLPRQMATVRMLELPSTDPREIADMVELQAGKLTPYSKDEVTADYKIIGPGREGYTRVMLAIVQRSVLRSRYSLLTEAGVNVLNMTVGTEGILNWFRRFAPAGKNRGATAVLDVDAGFSDFSVMSRNRLLFSRSILVGAESLMAGDAAMRDKLGREIAQSLQRFAGESGGVRVERLIVTGAGPNVPELAVFLGEQSRLPTEAVDALDVLRKRPPSLSLREPPNHVVSLTPLIGIGLAPAQAEYHLVPDSVRLRKELVARARNLTRLAVMVAAVLIALSLYGTLRYFFRQDRLAHLRREVVGNNASVERLLQMQTMTKVVMDRSDNRLAAVSLLAELRRRLPEPQRIFLDQLEFDTDAGTLQIGGTGQSSQAIRDLVADLEASELLMDVQEGGATERLPNGRYQFRLVCRLEAQHVG